MTFTSMYAYDESSNRLQDFHIHLTDLPDDEWIYEENGREYSQVTKSFQE